jgi:hypothetical protein
LSVNIPIIYNAEIRLVVPTNTRGEAYWHIAANSCLGVEENKVIPVLNEATRYGNEWRIGAMQH